MEVVIRDDDVLILIAELQAVSAAQPRVVDLWIDDVRILYIRTRRLTSEAAEVVHPLRIQAARDPGIGRNIGNPRLRKQTRLPDRRRRLAAVHPIESNPGIDQHAAARRIRHTGSNLLIEDINVAVRISTRDSWDVRRIEDANLALTESEEPIELWGGENVIANIAFIVIQRAAWQ